MEFWTVATGGVGDGCFDMRISVAPASLLAKKEGI